MINPGETPAVRINGKAQTVLSVSDEDGIGGSSEGLPIAPGMKKAGLVTTVSGYIKRVVVRCDNVIAGDTTISVDGALLPDLVSTTLPFTVGDVGRLLFIDGNTGSDSDDGLSLAGAFAGFAPPLGTTSGKRLIRGDVVYVLEKTGGYSDTISAGYSPGQPTIIDTGNVPDSGLPIGFVNYRGHRPLLTNKLKWLGMSSGGGQDDISFFGFEISETGSTGDRDPMEIGGANGVRIGAMVIHDSECPFHILGADYSTRISFLGNEIYHVNLGSSSNQNHSVYCGGFADQDEMVLDFQHIHHNEGGRGMQLHGHSMDDIFNGKMRFNNVHHQRCDGYRIGGTDESDNPDWVESLDFLGNTGHDNNSAGDPDFSDARFGNEGAVAGTGPTVNVRKNVFYNTPISINVHGAKQLKHSDNCYEGDFDIDAGAVTVDESGDSNAYPSCY